MKISLPLAYLATISVAEAVTVFSYPQLGIILHALILGALLLQSSLHISAGEPLRRLLISLSLIPLIRILSLSMPLAKIPLVYWYAIIALPILAATVVVAVRLHLTSRQLGLTPGRHITLQLITACIGFALGILEYFILRSEPLVRTQSWLLLAGVGVILLVGTGFTEELIFRGVLQSTTSEVLGHWGIFYTSALFAVMHLGYRSLWELLFVFTVALFFAWVVKRTGSIYGATLCHGIVNITLFMLAPYWSTGLELPTLAWPL